MSEISLDTFVTYKPSQAEVGFDFYPAPRAATREGERTKIVLGDIPLPEGVPYPTDSMTFFYGYKDTLEEFSRQHQRAEENRMSLVKVTAKLDVGQLIAGSINPDNVLKTRFLRLRMASAGLQQEILDEINRLSAERSGKGAKVFEKMLDACSRPDLLCDAVRSLPNLRHINSIAYHVPDGTPGGRQIATVFSTDVSEITFRGEGAFDIDLPLLD
jgi:hypothetical protein